MSRRFSLFACAAFASVCAVGCGGPGGSPPQAPRKLTINPYDKTLVWEPVPGATSYNLYVRQLAGDCMTLSISDLGIPATTDPKYPDVRSPHSIESFDRCRVCYDVGVTAENEHGESAMGTWLAFTRITCREQ